MWLILLIYFLFLFEKMDDFDAILKIYFEKTEADKGI